MKVRELLSGPEKWTQGVGARRANGSMTNPAADDAVCWCLSEAIGVCYRSDVMEKQRVRDAVLNATGQRVIISPWNDAPERTFEDVKKLVDELDI